MLLIMCLTREYQDRVDKIANFLYPNFEYLCVSNVLFITIYTKTNFTIIMDQNLKNIMITIF